MPRAHLAGGRAARAGASGWEAAASPQGWRPPGLSHPKEERAAAAAVSELVDTAGWEMAKSGEMVVVFTPVKPCLSVRTHEYLPVLSATPLCLTVSGLNLAWSAKVVLCVMIICDKWFVLLLILIIRKVNGSAQYTGGKLKWPILY